MKKILTALFAMSMVSVAHAEVYKITNLTKAHEKEIRNYAAEGEGDLDAIPTNKGILWVHFDSSAANTLRKAKVGECYNVSGDELNNKAKKVKCPTNTKNKKTSTTKKKMTQQQIDACVDKWVKAYRKERGQDAIVRYDFLNEWENECKAGKQP